MSTKMVLLYAISENIIAFTAAILNLSYNLIELQYFPRKFNKLVNRFTETFK